MVTQSLTLRKFSVTKSFLLYIPVIHKLSYSTSNDIFHWNVSPLPAYISSNDMHFRLYFVSPNSLVVSRMLKIFATTPGKVLHSVVKKRVSTPTNSTVFHFRLMLLYQCWIWYSALNLRSVQTQTSVYGSLYLLLHFSFKWAALLHIWH
jgi:hypothetical protein